MSDFLTDGNRQDLYIPSDHHSVLNKIFLSIQTIVMGKKAKYWLMLFQLRAV